MSTIPTTIRRKVLAACALLAASHAVAHADVLVVRQGVGPYFEIQDAVLAANPGDVILVGSGTYAPVTVQAKALSIVADTGAHVVVQGTTTVRNLAVDQVVVLSGLNGGGQTSNSASNDAGVGLLLRANAGFVRVQGCEYLGAVGYGDGGYGVGGLECCDLPPHDDGWDGCWVDGSSAGTTFTRTNLRGGRGARAHLACYCGTGDKGGDGLRVTNSTVAVYDGTLAGGRGGDNGGEGGIGGAGLRTQDSGGAMVSNTTMFGGRGGDGYDYIYSEGGDGGDGAVIGAGTAMQRIGCTFTPGVGGQACFGLFPPGQVGSLTSGAGTIFTFNVPPVLATSALVAREDTSLPISVTGTPGSMAVMRIARLPNFQSIPSQRGMLLVEQPIAAKIRVLGTIPAGGTLLTTLPLQPLALGLQSSTYYLQTSVIDDITGKTLGSSTVLTVLDSFY